jgi:hypothetical protein
MACILPFAPSRNNNNNNNSNNYDRRLRGATSDQGPISCARPRHVQRAIVAAAFAALMERLLVSGDSPWRKQQRA